MSLAGAEVVGTSAATVMLRLKDATSWWDVMNESPVWQDRIFHVLACLCGIVAAFALVIKFTTFYLIVEYLRM